MTKASELPLYFKVVWAIQEHPAVIIPAKILLQLWGRDSAYLQDINSDGRYSGIEDANSQFEKLLLNGEPLEIPQVNLFNVSGEELGINYSNGRHLTRYLIDECGASQIPLQVYRNDAEILIAAKLARYATAEEVTVIESNANSMALGIFHRAVSVLAEKGIAVSRESLGAEYAEYYKQYPFYEDMIPLAKMQDYFKPLEAARTKSWVSASLKQDFGIT